MKTTQTTINDIKHSIDNQEEENQRTDNLNARGDSWIRQGRHLALIGASASMQGNVPFAIAGGVSSAVANLGGLLIREYAKSEHQEQDLEQGLKNIRTLAYDVLDPKKKIPLGSELSSSQIHSLIKSIDYNQLTGEQKARLTPSVLKLVQLQIDKGTKQLNALKVDVNHQHTDLRQALSNLKSDVDMAFETNSAQQSETGENIKKSYENIHRQLNDINQDRERVSRYLAERQEQIDYDVKFQNLEYGVGILSSISTLVGNKRLAQQLTVSASAVASIGRVIAGCAGQGLLAGISPLGAGFAILSAISSISSLFGGDKGKSNEEIMMEALQCISEQIADLRQEMREYFEEVLSKLSDIDQRIITGFLEMKFDIATVHEQLHQLHSLIHSCHQQNQHYFSTVRSDIQSLHSMVGHNLKREKIDYIKGIVEEAMSYQIMGIADIQTVRLLTNRVLIALSGDMGCKSPVLVGEKMSREFIFSNPTELTRLLSTHGWELPPYLTLNTWQDAWSLPNDFFYTPSQVDHILTLGLAESNKEKLEIASTHTIANLIHCNSGQGYIVTLENTIQKFLNSENSTSLIIPLYLNLRFQLLFIEKDPLYIQYYGDNDNNLITMLNEITKITDLESPAFTQETDCHDISDCIPLRCSALWLISCISKLKHEESISKEKLSQMTSLQTDEEYTELHAVCQTQLKKTNFHWDNKSVNPLTWTYLVEGYINLYHKLNTSRHSADPITITTTTAEQMQQFQSIINDMECTQGMILRMRNPALFKRLLENYFRTTQELRQAVDNHLHTYEMTDSKNRNLGINKVLQDSHRRNLYDMLEIQVIPVATNHATSMQKYLTYYTSCENRIEEHNETFFYSHWFHGYNLIYGDDAKRRLRYQGKGTYKSDRLINDYVTSQTAQINLEIANYIQDYRVREPLQHNNRSLLFAEEHAVTKSIPCALQPADSQFLVSHRISNNQQPTTVEHPLLLPTSPELAEMIPDTFFLAQWYGIGEIVLYYDVKIEESKIEESLFYINAMFKLNETGEKLEIFTKQASYEPRFYQGTEALWRFYMDNQSPENANDLTTDNGDTSGYAHPLVCKPNLTFRQGFFHRMNTLKNANDDQRANNSIEIIKEFIENEKKALRTTWHDEIKAIINVDSDSNLGKLFSLWDAHFMILKTYLSSALPIDRGLTVEGLLSELASSSYATTSSELLQHMDEDRKESLSALLLNEEIIDNMQNSLAWIMEYHSTRITHPLFSHGSQRLMELMRTTAPYSKPETSTPDITIQLAKELMRYRQLLLEFSSVHPSDDVGIKQAQERAKSLISESGISNDALTDEQQPRITL